MYAKKLVAFGVLVHICVGVLGAHENRILKDIKLIVNEEADQIEPTTCADVSVDDIKINAFTKKLTKPRKTEVNNTYPIPPSSGLKVIIHGWGETGQEKWIEEMKEQYLKRDNFIVYVLDWSKFSMADYASAYCSVPKVARVVAKYVMDLHLSEVHLIGHSMGAHLAGLIGQNVQIIPKSEKIARITGLDATGPMYCPGPINNRLSFDDAYFVDAIHTDTEKFGCNDSLGTVDFFPNCGFEQPGCPKIGSTKNLKDVYRNMEQLFCNHRKGVEYFIESINSTQFQASPLIHCIRKSPLVYPWSTITMGEDVPVHARDSYFLFTKKSPPYALGY